MMDPKGRILLEHAYEAIVDAGVNPQELRGTNTGVFIGTIGNESEIIALYGTNQVRVKLYFSVMISLPLIYFDST